MVETSIVGVAMLHVAGLVRLDFGGNEGTVGVSCTSSVGPSRSVEDSVTTSSVECVEDSDTTRLSFSVDASVEC